MLTAIESVTAGVSDLPAALRIFRDALGLEVTADMHASVGLLSAWRHPVHEAVRLAALGIEPAKAPVHIGLPNGRPGRIMLVRCPHQELCEFTEVAA